MDQDETLQAKSPERAAAAQQLLGGELISKNVRISGRRTSVRLEPEMWEALEEVAVTQGCTIHDLCSAVAELQHPEASFTAPSALSRNASRSRTAKAARAGLHPHDIMGG